MMRLLKYSFFIALVITTSTKDSHATPDCVQECMTVQEMCNERIPPLHVSDVCEALAESCKDNLSVGSVKHSCKLMAESCGVYAENLNDLCAVAFAQCNAACEIP